MILAQAGASAPTFERIFPNFAGQCQTLYSTLVPVAVVLVVIGLISAIRYAQTPRSMLRPLITVLMIAMALGKWAEWTNDAQAGMSTVIEKMDAKPQDAAKRYMDLLVSKEAPKEKEGWFGLPSAAQIYEAFLWGALTVIGIIAGFVIWVAYIIQRFLVGLTFAFAPIFLGMLALRSTSNIGVRFIVGTVGILCWPLGWAAASIGTSNLIDVATEQGLVNLTNVYGLQTILSAAIIGGWIIITTLIAPVIIQSAIASGSSVGSALLSGTMTAGTAAAGTALQTGAAIASAGGTGATGTLATAGAAVAGGATAGAGSLMGSTMRGEGYPMTGGSVAGWFPHPSPSGGSSAGARSGGGDSGSQSGSSGQSASGGSNSSTGGAGGAFRNGRSQAANDDAPNSAAAASAAPLDLTHDQAVARLVEQSRQHPHS